MKWLNNFFAIFMLMYFMYVETDYTYLTIICMIMTILTYIQLLIKVSAHINHNHNKKPY